MTLVDTLANILSSIKNASDTGKLECTVAPASKLACNILKVMQEQGYIGKFELVDDKKSGKFKVELRGRINKCGVVKPRFSVKKTEFEKWEKRYLPAQNFGTLILATPHGVVSHYDAREKRTGGILLAYVY